VARIGQWLAYGALAVLLVLHNDIWSWDDPSRILGLPVGLTYHLAFMAAVIAVMIWLIRSAWPRDTLELLAGTDDDEKGAGDDGGRKDAAIWQELGR